MIAHLETVEWWGWWWGGVVPSAAIFLAGAVLFYVLNRST